MKYNEDVHPLYKSIGEKIEQWLITNCLYIDSLNKSSVVLLAYHNNLDRWVLREVLTANYRFIPDSSFTKEERDYPGELKFTLGEKS